MKKKSAEDVVTNDIFKTAMEEMSSSFRRLDVSQKNIALELMQVDKRLDAVEKNMSTKHDIHNLIDTLDAFTKKIIVHQNKSLVHDHRLNEIEPKLDDHEKRILILENPS